MWLNNFNLNGPNPKPIKRLSIKNSGLLSFKTTQKSVNDKGLSRVQLTAKYNRHLPPATTKFNRLIIYLMAIKILKFNWKMNSASSLRKWSQRKFRYSWKPKFRLLSQTPERVFWILTVGKVNKFYKKRESFPRKIVFQKVAAGSWTFWRLMIRKKLRELTLITW